MSKKTRSSKNKNARKALRDSGIREKNAIRKLERHLKKFPNDKQAQSALKRGPKITSGRKPIQRNKTSMMPIYEKGDDGKQTIRYVNIGRDAAQFAAECNRVIKMSQYLIPQGKRPSKHKFYDFYGIEYTDPKKKSKATAEAA